MPEMFSRTEMQQIVDSLAEPLVMHKQVKINHSDCPAGVDRKQRLYLKSKGDGVVMYCHHCGSKGFLRTSDKIRRVDELISLAEKETHHIAHGSIEDWWLCADTEIATWPNEAKLWWYSYELTQQDAYAYRARWSSTFSRLLLGATKTCYQGRAFGGKHPKYLTWHVGNSEVSQFVQLVKPQSTVVVVEDLVSAYKLHKAGCDVVCLLGTKADDHELNYIAQYKRALIWLDDDTAGIVGAKALYSRLTGILKCDIMSMQQPKEMPLSYLKGIADA